MLGPSHRILGALAGALYGSTAGMGWRATAVAAVVATAVSNGPTSPDMDQTDGWQSVARMTGPLSRVFAHRHVTHWFGWPVLAWWQVTAHLPPIARWAAYALIVGWASHLVGDFVFGKLPLLPWGGPWVGLGLDTGGVIETGRTKSGRRVFPFGPARAVMVAALVWVFWVLPTAADLTRPVLRAVGR